MKNVFSRIPFLRIILPFFIGILLAYFLQPFKILSIGFVLVLFGTASLLALYLKLSIGGKYKLGWTYALTLFFAFLLSGILLFELKDHKHLNAHYRKEWNEASGVKVVALKILSNAKSSQKYQNYKAELNAYKNNGEWVACRGSVLLKVRRGKDNEYHIGDKLLAKGYVAAPITLGNPGEFSYKDYLLNKGIEDLLYCKPNNLVLLKNASPYNFRNIALHIQRKFVSVLERADLSKRELAISSALLIGMKDRLDDEVREDFSRAGVMHLLAVSGLHVGLVFVVLSFLTNRFIQFRSSRILGLLVIVAGIWFYALVTGLSPSVMRASLMFSLIAIASAMRRNISSLNAVFVSAFLLLLIDPRLILDISFQLSYSAVIGIVLLYPKLNSLSPFKYRPLKLIWSLLSVSLAAQLFTVPFTLYYFGKLPLYFLLANLVVVPMATLSMYVGMAYVLLSWLEVLGDLLAVLLQKLLHIMDVFIAFVSRLPYAVAENLFWNGWNAFFFTLILAALTAYLHLRRGIFLIACIASLLVFISYRTYQSSEFSNQNFIVVYNSPKGTTWIDLIEGKYCKRVIVSDSASNTSIIKGMNDADRFFALSEVERVQMNTAQNFVLTMKGFNIAYVVNKLKQPVHCDVLVYNGELAENELNETVIAKEILLLNDRGFKVSRELLVELQRKEQYVYPIFDKGAKIIKL